MEIKGEKKDHKLGDYDSNTLLLSIGNSFQVTSTGHSVLLLIEISIQRLLLKL